MTWAAKLLLAHFTALGQIEVGYGYLFMICGLAYVVAWIAMHMLVPRFQLVNLE